jgi:glucose-6-phosphate-specific signal transduction histidine kinase
VRLAVEDNGVGFKVEEALARKDSFGLSGMRERVALLGGRFEIRSYPKNGSGSGTAVGTRVRTSIRKRSVDRQRTGRGTKILIRLPVAKQPPETSSVEPIAAKPMGAKTMGARTAWRIGAVGA